MSELSVEDRFSARVAEIEEQQARISRRVAVCKKRFCCAPADGTPDADGVTREEHYKRLVKKSEGFLALG